VTKVHLPFTLRFFFQIEAPRFVIRSFFFQHCPEKNWRLGRHFFFLVACCHLKLGPRQAGVPPACHAPSNRLTHQLELHQVDRQGI